MKYKFILLSPWLLKSPGLEGHGLEFWVYGVPTLILWFMHRPQSSSFLGLPYRIPNMNPKKELLGGLWVVCTSSVCWKSQI